ncbi:MAG: Dps family protein [Myxococcota bacterium]
MKVDVGLDKETRKQLGESLGRVLADTFTLYLTTHNFHWNVTGPMFQTLHLQFETQYNELWLAVDEIAERIRALGAPAPATYAEYAKLTSLKEPVGVPAAKDMIRHLQEGHEAVNHTCSTVLDQADGLHDQVTVDLLTRRMTEHQKTAWMLRSLLE